MMSPEEYERIKEAEKERLRAAKKLQSMQQALRRQQALRAAVEGLTSAQQALDENEALTDRLAYETARSEARLDLALEAASEKAPPSENAPPAAADLDEEQTAAQARATVRQFKQALGLTPGGAAGGSPAAGASSEEAPSDEELLDKERPDKTLGRM